MGYLFFPNETPEQAEARRQANASGVPQASAAPLPGQQLVNAMMQKKMQQLQTFPTAPGGAAPSFGTQLANMFTLRHNGGLF